MFTKLERQPTLEVRVASTVWAAAPGSNAPIKYSTAKSVCHRLKNMRLSALKLPYIKWLAAVALMGRAKEWHCDDEYSNTTQFAVLGCKYSRWPLLLVAELERQRFLSKLLHPSECNRVSASSVEFVVGNELHGIPCT